MSLEKEANTHVIAVLNQKGRVGKTTIAIHVARALQLSGHDVLHVDSDPKEALATGPRRRTPSLWSWWEWIARLWIEMLKGWETGISS